MLVNMHEAKTQLSKLVDAALNGEEVVVARNGTPVVVLTPYVHTKAQRTPGRLVGKVRILAGFDQLPEDIAGPLGMT
jgi:prevent-host-death family protein